MSGRTLPPGRLLAVVAPVSVVGLAAFAAAAVFFALEPGPATTVSGVGVFLLASTLAERFPVPLEGVDANGVSLGFVFAVAALVLFGWAPATVVYASAPTIVALLRRSPPIRSIFNAGVFGLTGTAAGTVLAQLGGGRGTAGVAAHVVLTAVILFAVNLLLVSAAIAASGSGRGYRHLVRSYTRALALPFALMASTALILVVLWQRTPYLIALLVGPLIAISLYQRSTHKALQAMRLALTDPLTGLGNHRHFHERLQRELARAEDTGRVMSLCLLDVDDFKRINDRFGHPAGDRALAQVATRLRQGGEAFRLGGDEFALLLPGSDETAALAAAQSIVKRISEWSIGEAGVITVSAGVAAFPQHAHERDSLIRLADAALYWAKENGKNQVRIAGADDLSDLDALAGGADRVARFRAAAALARAVDARDVYTGSHSERVAAIAGAIAERLGLPAPEVELTRVAGSLHDLGKLAIPEEILQKPAELTTAEWLVVQRHPQIGHRMLEGLGASPVAEWVLHHHERWDGSGYPDGLAGDDIPLGSRIVFVADAFDAMTFGRLYRSPLDRDEALAEIERCAGGQFDPQVVRALFDAVGLEEPVGV